MDIRFERQLLAWLKPVSRSFYLSVRFLPRRIRPTIAVAYLLARASDTIADANALPADQRLETLQRLAEAIHRDGIDLTSLVQECVRHQGTGGERLLLDALPRILAAARRLPAPHHDLVEDVLEKILRGQSLDLMRFEGKTGIHALKTDDELDEYIYLVAGCVGEFWTKLCLWEWPGYSALPETELIDLGIDFGKGLQLVNVLRDVPLDLRAGRCYLPVAVPERLIAEPGLGAGLYDAWFKRACLYLQAAWNYAGHIRPPSVRFACALPALIGIRTLRLLAQAPPFSAGVKVRRTEVYRLACQAFAAACSRPAHRWIGRRQFGERRTSLTGLGGKKRGW